MSIQDTTSKLDRVAEYFDTVFGEHVPYLILTADRESEMVCHVTTFPDGTLVKLLLEAAKHLVAGTSQTEAGDEIGTGDGLGHPDKIG
jgi:hypothetical protein